MNTCTCGIILAEALPISFQLAGAILLATSAFIPTKKRILRKVYGSGSLIKDGTNGTYHYSESALRDEFRDAYVSLFGIVAVGLGYVTQIFIQVSYERTMLLLIACIVESFLFVAIGHGAGMLIARERDCTVDGEILESNEVQPAMKSISDEKIGQLFSKDAVSDSEK